MRKFYSHYDNLKVARDAPPEVIRAAWRSLCAKYHPDRHPDDPEAARVMTLINAANDVLSDPVRRKQHDDWIASVENQLDEIVHPRHTPYPEYTPFNGRPDGKGGSRYVRRGLMFVALPAILIGGVGFALHHTYATPEADPTLLTYEATRSPSAPRPRRPAIDPGGKTAPAETSGYVPGYEQRVADGSGSVTVDNSPNESDVFVKLFALDGGGKGPERVFFVEAGQRFTVEGLRGGHYDLRYRELASGNVARSEAFDVPFVPVQGSQRPGNVTMRIEQLAEPKATVCSIKDIEF